MSLLNQTVKQVKRLFGVIDTKPQSNGVLEELQRRIKYHFHDPSLLILALTHKSSVNPEDKKGLFSNERLEFLGDAVLDCLVTEKIYLRYPKHSEGQLSKIKSLLVSRKIIGVVARSIDLGKYLIMGQSEKKSGGRTRMSIVSNALEAVLGAVYLDGGINRAREILELLLFNKIEQFVNDKENINYKSKILELAQGDGFGIPTYPLIAAEGPDHEKKFVVGIDIAGIRLGEGSGSNKKEAQQNAAYKALQEYGKEIIKSRLKGD